MMTVVRIGAAAFVVFYLLTDPVGAAHFVHSLLDGLHSAGTSLSHFVSHLGGN